MEFKFSGLSAEDADVLGLGAALGENHAFGLVAGRCAAAQAATLKRLREEKKYKRFTPHWNEFCTKVLGMSGAQADRIIRLLEEFGPGYFEVAQLTRISAETFRAIQPSIKEGVLHCNGEAIELEPRNAHRIAEAVAELRDALPRATKEPARELEMHERLAEIDERCVAIVLEFQEISRKERDGENWLLFTSTLSSMCSALDRIKRENGLG